MNGSATQCPIFPFHRPTVTARAEFPAPRNTSTYDLLTYIPSWTINIAIPLSQSHAASWIYSFAHSRLPPATWTIPSFFSPWRLFRVLNWPVNRQRCLSSLSFFALGLNKYTTIWNMSFIYFWILTDPSYSSFRKAKKEIMNQCRVNVHRTNLC